MDRTPAPAASRPASPARPTRADRLKAALKANMAKRKAQARARIRAEDPSIDGKTDD